MKIKAIEAGRVLSSKNEGVIRSAIVSLTEIVSALMAAPAPEEDPKAKGKKKPMAKTDEENGKKAMESIRAIEAAILKKSDTIDNQRSALRDAAKAKLDPLGNTFYVWTREIFPDVAIFEVEGRDDGTSQLLAMSYVKDQLGAILFGDPYVVEMAYIPKQATTQESDRKETPEGDVVSLREAESVVPLIEKAIQADGTTMIKIADPGWGSSGYYSKDVLKEYGPQVFREGLHMYWNHPTQTEERERPERDLRDLAATLTEAAHWEDNGPKGPGLYAKTKVFDHYRGAVESLAESIGVSMNSNGTATIGEAEGRKGRIITSLVSSAGDSIDFVTKAGRGGEILSLMESARSQAWAHQIKENKEADPMEKLTPEELTQLKEAAVKMPELMTRLQESETKNVRLTERLAVSDARDFVKAQLKESKLPEITKTRLVESLSSKAVVKDGEIDKEAFGKIVEAAIADETAYLTELGGKGQVRGMGTIREANNGDEKPVDAASLKESFIAMGMSEAQATIAANGR